MNNATRAQGIQTLVLIEDQKLDLEQTQTLNLFLPKLGAGIRNGTIPSLELFEAVCQGRVKPEYLEPKWKVDLDGTIRFTVTSTGTTGTEWIPQLEGQGYKVWDYAKSVFGSPNFPAPTKVGTIHHCAVIPGEFFEDGSRITKTIRAEGARRKYRDPHPEIAGLVRQKFTDDELKAMGLWWMVVMHKAIKDSDGDPSMLAASRYDDGREVGACDGRLGSRWRRVNGFLFVLPQVNPQP